MLSSVTTQFANLLGRGEQPEPEDDVIVPPAFLCPITHLLMEYPHMTMAGMCYEGIAIQTWLARHSKDPLSGTEMTDLRLIPNHALRSQIQTWIGQHPAAAKKFRNPAAKPLTAAPQAAPAQAQAPASSKQDPTPSATPLKQVVHYLGKRTTQQVTAQRASQVTTTRAQGRVYTIQQTPDHKITVRCGQHMCQAPAPAVFACADGIAFYDPTEMSDLLTTTSEEEKKDPCRYGSRCTNKACAFPHPFACFYGVDCKKAAVCKFLHPHPDSVIPLGSAFPLSQACKYGTSCSNRKCKFAHPQGRVRLERKQKQVYLTHDLDLNELAVPKPLAMEQVPGATKFRFQGECVFFFTPYPGPWAKEHFQKLEMHRYDPKRQRYVRVGEWALEGHYINCAIAEGRFLVISFWPYEDEAMRAVWEALRRERQFDKTIKGQQKLIQGLEASREQASQVISRQQRTITRQQKELYRQQEAIRRKDAKVRHLQDKEQQRRQQAAERQAAWEARKSAREAEKRARRMRQAAERARKERFRLRDPIHVYALRDQRVSGLAKDDWQLVLDYHKGAHDLELCPSEQGQLPRLLITEADSVFEFELTVPPVLTQLADLPVVPGKLCPDF